MLLRLFLFLLEYAVLVGVPLVGVYFVSRKLLGPRRERERRRQFGRRNAQLLEAHAEETCFICMKATDHNADVYDDRRGWYHQTCWAQLLGETT